MIHDEVAKIYVIIVADLLNEMYCLWTDIVELPLIGFTTVCDIVQIK
jgi:hypothetical protein